MGNINEGRVGVLTLSKDALSSPTCRDAKGWRIPAEGENASTQDVAGVVNASSGPAITGRDLCGDAFLTVAHTLHFSPAISHRQFVTTFTCAGACEA